MKRDLEKCISDYEYGVFSTKDGDSGRILVGITEKDQREEANK